jgi:hypothetical protein
MWLIGIFGSMAYSSTSNKMLKSTHSSSNSSLPYLSMYSPFFAALSTGLYG